jgi:hypothetical protein
MLRRIENQGFFRNRDRIIEKAQKLNLGKLYVIAPNGGTILEDDIFHLLYSDPKSDESSLKSLNVFLQALQEEFKLSDIRLHNQEALEEKIIISPGETGIVKARLSNLICIEDLAADVSLNKQKVTSIPLPSKEELIRRILSYNDNQEENKNEPPHVSNALVSLHEVEKTSLLTSERKRRSSNETVESEALPSSSKRIRTKDLEEKPRLAASPVSASLGQPLSGALFARPRRQDEGGIFFINALSPEQQQAIQQAARILGREIEKNPGCRDSMLASFEEELERNGLIQNDRIRANQVAAI